MDEETPMSHNQHDQHELKTDDLGDPGITITPKELTPEEKKGKRKEMLKRLGIVSAVTYGIVLAFIILWASFAYGKEFIIFDYLPISQEGFGNFWFYVFNVMWGLTVLAALCFALIAMAKSLLAKKEEVEKKKKWSKKALFSGIGFFALAALWLVGLWFLGPRLVTDDRYSSAIKTDPSNTIDLTAPVEIEFDASGLPIDDDFYSILSYTWNFGDGETGNGSIVSHRYTQKGTKDGRYTVILTVDYMDIKSGEQFETEFTTEVVIANELVAAYFTANPDSGEVPLTVKFDAGGSYDPDGEIVSYDWDMDGDGRFDDAEGEKVEYEFKQEGSFEISLRVTDNNGEYNISTMTIEAGSVNGLRAVINVDDHEGELFLVNEKYNFDAGDSEVKEGKITKYLWDFGDGQTTSSKKVSHTYKETGFYEITLTVSDANGNSDDTTFEIEVVETGSAPVADFTATPVSGTVPLDVEFDASGSTDADKDIVQYEWDFDNDGRIDETGDGASHTYQESGTYEARLVVMDAEGNKDETTQKINVSAQSITAVLEVDKISGEVPLTVRFDASGSTYKGSTIVSYEYNFGDGSDPYIGNSSITYKYARVGTFNASVTVLGADGTKDTESVQIVVRQVALTACFTVNSDSATAPLYLTVDPACSEGTISGYEWDFGDGEISFDRKPETHVYDEVGTYTVTLEITGKDGIVDIFEKDVTVK